MEDTAILRHKGIKSIQTAVLSEVHSVTEDTKIEDLLPLITKTNSSIYVVNEERELKGLVPLSSIVVEMTGKDKNEINDNTRQILILVSIITSAIVAGITAALTHPESKKR